MLRAYVHDLGENSDDHIPLIKFAYNNSYQSSVCMTPHEALYDRHCRSPVCWEEVGNQKLYGPKFVEEINSKVALIKINLHTNQSR